VRLVALSLFEVGPLAAALRGSPVKPGESGCYGATDAVPR